MYQPVVSNDLRPGLGRRAMVAAVLLPIVAGCLWSEAVLANPATQSAMPAAGSGDIIVDDLDHWEQPQCVTDPCPGYGFMRLGPDEYWRQNTDPQDVLYRNRALWTGGALSEQESTNSAIWATGLPDSGPWEVAVFIPRMRTDRADTVAARYCVGTRVPPLASSEHESVALSSAARCDEVIIDQAANTGRWVVLDTYEFSDHYGYVTLSDWVAPGDSQFPVSVLFDAVRWQRPDSGAEIDVDWIASPVLGECRTPEPCCWNQRSYSPRGWSSVTIPDLNSVASRSDRFYRGTFYLPVAADVQINFRSDDGLWMYLDGELLGEDSWVLWFQECGFAEGCYNGGNPATRCGLDYSVAPIWRRLEAGEHVIAVDLQNALGGSYLDVRLRAAIPDVEVQIAVDRGEGGRYRVGDPIRICYSVSMPIFVRFYDCPPGLACREILNGLDDGQGGCVGGFRISPPAGRERLVLRAFANSSSTAVLAEDETYFYVDADPPNTPIPPSVTPSRTPSSTPSREPTATPPVPGPTPQPTVPTRAPEKDSFIVFVHGWQGLVGKKSCAVKPTEDSKDNEFGLMTEKLREAGYKVFFVNWESSPKKTARIEESADCIKRQLDQLPTSVRGKQRVFIAHSMGGLVVRDYLSRYTPKLASTTDRLITFGSPHLGVTDSGSLGRLISLIRPGRRLDCEEDPGTCQLSLEYVQRIFNEENPVHPGMRYDLIGGTGTWSVTNKFFRNENDGLIDIGSAVGLLKGKTSDTRRAWKVRDTHTSFAGKAAPYADGSDSRLCLENILGGEGLVATNERPQCSSLRVTSQQMWRQENPTLAVSHLADDSLVAGEQFLGRLAVGETRMHGVPVDGSMLQMQLSWQATDIQLRWELPDGQVLSTAELLDLYPNAVLTEDRLDELRFLEVEIPMPMSGNWNIAIQEVSGSETDYTLSTALGSSIVLDLTHEPVVRSGDRIHLSADVRGAGQQISVEGVEAKWELGGRERTVRLNWDPLSRRYIASVIAQTDVVGIAFEVTARGRLGASQPYTRVAQTMVAIAGPDVYPRLPIGRTGRIYLPLASHGSRLDCPTREREPNDSRAEAGLLGSTCPEVWVAGTIAEGDPRDAYQIDVTSAARFRAELSLAVNSGDLDLYLFREGDAAFLAKSENTGNDREQIDIDLGPGRYFLLIFPAGGGTATGSYDIRWSVQP